MQHYYSRPLVSASQPDKPFKETKVEYTESHLASSKLLELARYLTGSFSSLEPQSPSIDVFGLHKVRQWTDLKALKL